MELEKLKITEDIKEWYPTTLEWEIHESSFGHIFYHPSWEGYDLVCVFLLTSPSGRRPLTFGMPHQIYVERIGDILSKLFGKRFNMGADLRAIEFVGIKSYRDINVVNIDDFWKVYEKYEGKRPDYMVDNNSSSHKIKTNRELLLEARKLVDRHEANKKLALEKFNVKILPPISKEIIKRRKEKQVEKNELMSDEDELLKLCEKSIEQRIIGMDTGWFGGGFGESTQLKHLICRLTDLPFSLVRRAIDSFDEVQGWAYGGYNRKKKKEYYDFLRPKQYGEKGYKKEEFIEDYGLLMKDFLWNEWKNGHEHRYFTEKESERSYREVSSHILNSSEGITYKSPPQRQCRTCGEWEDLLPRNHPSLWVGEEEQEKWSTSE